jgi:hypothetical protein
MTENIYLEATLTSETKLRNPARDQRRSGRRVQIRSIPKSAAPLSGTDGGDTVQDCPTNVRQLCAEARMERIVA